MARILFLTELLPYPLVSGAKIRAYYVLRHLSQAHEVTLASFVRGDDRPEDVEHLRQFAAEVWAVPMRRSALRNVRAGAVSLLTGCPAVIAREEIAGMRRRLQALLGSRRFEVVHADQIPMAQYGLLRPGAPVKRLLDQHNATFQVIERLARHEPALWKRLLLKREARAFARYEARVCQRFDAVTFVTEVDRQALLARTGWRSANAAAMLAERSRAIPICIDTAAVPPVAPVAEPFRVTHVGTMHWPPNVEGVLWFVDEIWPAVRARVPSARLTLIGKNPPPELRALEARPDVDVTGYVEDLSPFLAETAAFVVPLRAAGGMRVKIVDAWCWGLPVVSTAVGAEGIATRPGENVLIADDGAQFARGVVQVLTDRGLQSRLRTSGRRWVEQHYDWRSVYTAWDEVYGRLLGAE